MKRYFYEDRMNDLYETVVDGNLDAYYDLKDYLSENGYREWLYGYPDESCTLASI